MDIGAALRRRLRRVEFIGDGLGVYVGPHEIGLAHLSKGLFRIELGDTSVVPLPGCDRPGERRHALTDAVLGFVRAHKLGGAAAVLALPRDAALLNRLVLPAAAAENLREVVEYEMTRVIPIPKAELHYDFTMRRFGAERIEVLVMCIPQAAVREHIDALEDAFVRPVGIIISSAAIADFYCFCREEITGPVGLLLGADEGIELTVLTERRLVASVVMPAARVRDGEGLERLVARELTDELVGLDEVALYKWGATNGNGSQSELLGAENLLSVARERLAAPIEFFDTEEHAILPAVGAALGAVHEGTVAVNLLPVESRPGAEGGRWLLTAVLCLLLVVLAVAWGASAIARDAVIRGELDAELERLEPRVARVKQVEEEAAALRKRIETIAEGRNLHAVAFLAELTELLPDDAYLTTFRFRNGQVQIDGFAQAASELIQTLEDSELFRNVKFNSPTTKAKGRDRFSISMGLE